MKLKIVIAASAAVLLSGCHLFNDNSSDMAATAEADMSTYFAQRLAAGRAHLDRGRPTLAIAAFRQASYSPAFAAEAYNGMAVAYARIGRDDVARHFFTQAVTRAPADERYSRNLARLETQMEMLASTRQGLAAEEAVARAMDSDSLARAAIPAKPAGLRTGADSGLVRVSKHEVRLNSAQEANSGRAAVTVTTGDASQYPVRIKVATPQPGQTRNYPVRVSLAPSS